MKILFLFILALLPITAHAADIRGLKRGYIISQSGEKCWYTQSIQENSHHFFGRATQNVTVMTFDEDDCMSYKDDFQLAVNEQQINNIISRWYSHPDAAFMTNPGKLKAPSGLQTTGWCMQSTKYPLIAITIDYISNDGAITEVMHGQGLQCK